MRGQLAADRHRFCVLSAAFLARPGIPRELHCIVGERSMRHFYPGQIAESRETERQLRQGTVEIVSGCKFGLVAKALWPHKTAAHLAAIAKTNERAAWRWLSGEHEPPGCLIAAVVQEITKRE
jgi:hypothetical protein